MNTMRSTGNVIWLNSACQKKIKNKINMKGSRNNINKNLQETMDFVILVTERSYYMDRCSLIYSFPALRSID